MSQYKILNIKNHEILVISQAYQVFQQRYLQILTGLEYFKLTDYSIMYIIFHEIVDIYYIGQYSNSLVNQAV